MLKKKDDFQQFTSLKTQEINNIKKFKIKPSKLSKNQHLTDPEKPPEKKKYKILESEVKSKILIDIKKGILLRIDLDSEPKPLAPQRLLKHINKIGYQEYNKLLIKVLNKYVYIRNSKRLIKPLCSSQMMKLRLQSYCIGEKK